MAAVDGTYGVLLIGVLMAGILYGFTCVQTWYYFTCYPSDPWYYKLLVAGTLFFDTVHQALITHVVYTYVITYFGSNDSTYFVWSITGQAFFNVLTTLLVQCFLTMRIWRLSNKNWFMTGSALTFVVAEFAIGLGYPCMLVRFTSFAQVVPLKTFSLTVNVLAAAGDALIAGYLCYLLQKFRTGFRRSETVINKLIVFTVNTGLLTSLCAIASFISYNAWPNTFIYIAFYFNIGRLYCNSLLATLNARKRISGESNTDHMSLSDCRSNHTNIGTGSKRTPNNISIKIDTVTTQEFVQDEQYSASSSDLKNPMVVV